MVKRSNTRRTRQAGTMVATTKCWIGAMDGEEDIAPISYKWEQGIQASWETVREDEEGRILAPSDKERSYRAKRHRFTQSIRRGLIRFLVLALDCADSAQERDFRPTRLEVCRQSCKQFIAQYFDQNPISQLSLVITKDRIAEKISDLSGNSKLHIHQLSEINKTKGLPSLQNTIHLALTTLQHIPNYGHRELLILYSSLSSCDPSNIFDTLELACKLKLRISIISLTAEVYICKHICELTGGRFSVALDSSHLLELLQQHTIPPPELQTLIPLCTDFVYMGFPKRQVEGVAHPVYE
ncbi:VWA domain-containing protein, partial [archaeon]